MTRANTRATLVSTTATSMPSANAITARAVYGPMPGNNCKVCTSPGTCELWCATMCRAASCKFLHRRGYPRPLHNRNKSAKGAAAQSLTVGYSRMNNSYLGTTRESCVCCAITSLTNTDQRSRVLRHGKSRNLGNPHCRSGAASRFTSPRCRYSDQTSRPSYGRSRTGAASRFHTMTRRRK